MIRLGGLWPAAMAEVGPTLRPCRLKFLKSSGVGEIQQVYVSATAMRADRRGVCPAIVEISQTH
jgi:hypothetical protein